jgi:hypothetical protein
MAIYSATVISVNNIGGTDVTLQENNGVGTVNQLLATVGNEKLIIDSVDIYSTNKSQIEQTIEFIKHGINGNEKNFVKSPILNTYQLNNTIKNVKTKKFSIDEDTTINYTILGNTNVKLTLNINKEARKVLSYTEILNKANKSSIFNQVIKEIGFRESDEIKTWDGRPTEDFRELQEIRDFPADGVMPEKYTPASKKSNGICLAIVLVAASFITFISGKGEKIYKFKV